MTTILETTLLASLEKMHQLGLTINYPNIAKVEGLTTQRVNQKYKALSTLIENMKVSQKLDQAEQAAADRKGTLLDTEWKGPREKLTWKCHDPKHLPFQQTYWHVSQKNKWCPECQSRIHGRPRKTDALKLAHQVAQERMGKCLSTAYIGVHENLTWKCHNPEHAEWQTTFGNVVYGGNWCRRCSHEKE